jgi:hypothetical protein
MPAKMTLMTTAHFTVDIMVTLAGIKLECQVEQEWGHELCCGAGESVVVGGQWKVGEEKVGELSQQGEGRPVITGNITIHLDSWVSCFHP